jgi:ABC-type oligopeptide transport system substrate-binding subunit
VEADMTNDPITRRALCATAILEAACKSRANAYFGDTTVPAEQRLVYIVGAEPATLDPGKTTGGYESFIVPAMFESLTSYHPATGEAMAALATHCEANADRTQFTFYLRGHPKPRGVKFPNTDSLRNEYATGKLQEDFSRGHAAPPDAIPARWSDGTVITADDFVYSWRRVVDPATATPQYAYFLHYVKNGKQISAGQLGPESLRVGALDDFTLQVDLRAPTLLFLKLTSHRILAPVSRRAVEATKRTGRADSWTEPGHIVTSGAFTLAEHRPYDRVVLRRNPHYYESAVVALREISFVIVVDGTTGANLYKTGDVHSMSGASLPPLLAGAVERKADAYSAPAFFHILPVFNPKRPPFDNVLLRYALNMAIDKKQIVAPFGRGRAPAQTLVPPLKGYEPPQSVAVTLDGRTFDILSYNPEAARQLLAKAGFPDGIGGNGRRLTLEYLFPQLPHSQTIAEILRQELRTNLNLDVRLVKQDFQAWTQKLMNNDFVGLAEFGGGAEYVDPNAMLEWFVTGGPASQIWSDPNYDIILARANATTDPAARMRRLAESEAYLLKAMPVLPLLYYGFVFLQKPFVRGLSGNPLDFHPFKYAWIDTKWRPQ